MDVEVVVNAAAARILIVQEENIDDLSWRKSRGHRHAIYPTKQRLLYNTKYVNMRGSPCLSLSLRIITIIIPRVVETNTAVR